MIFWIYNCHCAGANCVSGWEVVNAFMAMTKLN